MKNEIQQAVEWWNREGFNGSFEQQKLGLKYYPNGFDMDNEEQNIWEIWKKETQETKTFKVGDKVKIPKTSTAKIANFKSFLQEMSNYKLDYLIVRNIDNSGYWEISLKRNDGINLFEDGFMIQDLEHYEEYNETFNPEAHSHLIIDFDKVETIEEAAEKYCIISYIDFGDMTKHAEFQINKSFIEGAKSEASKNYWFKIFQEEQNSKQLNK